ncbi:hypothetical protein D3C78_1429700 [compost metagenome]
MMPRMMMKAKASGTPLKLPVMVTKASSSRLTRSPLWRSAAAPRVPMASPARLAIPAMRKELPKDCR